MPSLMSATFYARFRTLFGSLSIAIKLFFFFLIESYQNYIRFVNWQILTEKERERYGCGFCKYTSAFSLTGDLISSIYIYKREFATLRFIPKLALFARQAHLFSVENNVASVESWFITLKLRCVWIVWCNWERLFSLNNLSSLQIFICRCENENKTWLWFNCRVFYTLGIFSRVYNWISVLCRSICKKIKKESWKLIRISLVCQTRCDMVS